MKNSLLKIILFLTAAVLVSCSKEDGPEIPAPEINYAGISGTWQLVQWRGEQMDGNRYCYMVIERKPDEETGNRRITVYENLGSSVSHTTTSSYSLAEDEYGNVYINGSYDYSGGLWNCSYLISDLTASQMTWTVDGDDSDVSVYVRCESVPDDILAGTRNY